MGIGTFVRRLTAASLAALLVSCTATKPLAAGQGPTSPLALGRSVLVIQEMRNERVTHDWKPLEDFDLRPYQHLFGTRGIGGPVELTSTSLSDDQIDRACFEVWERCENRCNGSPLPPHAEHYIASYRSVRAALRAYCTDACRKESDDCRRKLKQQAAEALEFRATGEAVDWLKRHKKEIALGAVVIITGVVFHVVLSGGGILILAPALLLTLPGAPSEPHLAEALR